MEKKQQNALPPMPNLEEKPALVDMSSEEVKSLLEAWKEKFLQLVPYVKWVTTYHEQLERVNGKWDWEGLGDPPLFTFGLDENWMVDIDFSSLAKIEGIYSDDGFEDNPFYLDRNILSLPVLYEEILRLFQEKYGKELPPMPNLEDTPPRSEAVKVPPQRVERKGLTPEQILERHLLLKEATDKSPFKAYAEALD